LIIPLARTPARGVAAYQPDPLGYTVLKPNALRVRRHIGDDGPRDGRSPYD